MDIKQQQFNEAMERYRKNPVYLRIGWVVSGIIISSQAILGHLAVFRPVSGIEGVVAFVSAYVMADFVNGLVHMYMDNSEDYQSFVGPLVASFHLHHRTPAYKQKPLIEVYWHEAGSKVWLAAVMAVSAVGAWVGVLQGIWLYFMLFFSVLSCIAELSHYLCHTPAGPFARFLGRAGVLMSARYHLGHHTADNTRYTFLNCITDPIVNWIAKITCRGYKQNTDLHYAFYVGEDTENR